LNSTVSIILFWVAALIMLAAVLAWILPALFRRTEAAAALDRRELNIAVYRDQYRELENDHRSGLLSDAQRDAAAGNWRSALRGMRCRNPRPRCHGLQHAPPSAGVCWPWCPRWHWVCISWSASPVSC
jgi:type II secretory pathway pseudopilin PulG